MNDTAITEPFTGCHLNGYTCICDSEEECAYSDKSGEKIKCEGCGHNNASVFEKCAECESKLKVTKIK